MNPHELLEIAARNGRNYCNRVDSGSEYTPDQIEFLKAINRYKRRYNRPFPTWAEVLAVFVSLGYSKGE